MDSTIQVDFDTGRPVEISAECRTVMGKTYSRTQFPLTLAWGLTIHKCQSLTLDRICISLADLFVPGLLYVSASRVRRHRNIRFVDIPDRDGMQTIDFPSVTVPKDIVLHMTRESEEQWRAAALQKLPGVDFVNPAQAEFHGTDQELEEEFYLPEEEEEDFFAEYDNDDFFLEDELEEEDEQDGEDEGGEQ